MTNEHASSKVSRARRGPSDSAPHAEPAADVHTRATSLGGSQVRKFGAGHGQIPVVVVHGAGDCMDSWLPVLRGVAAFTKVVAFDRPGIGRSPAGPPATPEQYVGQLRDLLANEGGRPAVLVGHSLGGLITQLYARRHPDTVAGLVLIDATPESIAEDPAAKVGFAVSGLVATLLKTVASTGLLSPLLHLGAVPLYPESRHYRSLLSRSEFGDWVDAATRSFAHNAHAELHSVLPTARYALDHGDLSTGRPFGDVPLAVLSSRAYGKAWVTLQGTVATRSRRGTHIPTGDRFHNIHMAHPDVVIDTIRSIHRAATATAGCELRQD